jgi:hypothetical protein
MEKDEDDDSSSKEEKTRNESNQNIVKPNINK